MSVNISGLLLQDVDTIYLTQDTRELNMQDFIHLENRYIPPSLLHEASQPFCSSVSMLRFLPGRDLVAIIAALEYNQWFTKLSTKDYKLVNW